MLKKKIVVLLGGISPEKEISLKSGNAVFQAVENLGYEAIKINPADKNWMEKLISFSPDMVFIALHGIFGEDGRMQALLEFLDIPYTGCGVLTSAIAMDKIYSKKIFSYDKIPTPAFITLNLLDKNTEKYKKDLELWKDNFGFPCVVKAPNQGSTIGIYFVHKEEDLEKAIDSAFSFEEKIMLEEFIVGMEVTIGVLGNEEPIALPSLEIISKTGVYDYEAKYTVGLSEHIIPARITLETEALVKKLALDAYKALDCQGFARVDFMLDEKNQPFVLEVNTIPGFTETSLVPDAAKVYGLSFDQLVEVIINYSLAKRRS
ncbi:MAG: D-alanine--D-alanine ligase [Clostridia bacterium]